VRAIRAPGSGRVVFIVLAQIGPLTAMLEGVAASVGAGVVLGGVALGSVRLAVGWSRRRIERRALTDGYLGGLFGAAMAICDLILRYVV
jgi:hypothetical protein